MYEMKKEVVFKIKNKNYDINKYYFQKDKKITNINEVNTEKIVLCNKIPYGPHGANTYYIGNLNGGFESLCIVINDTELCTNNINVLANNKRFLKYIEIWNKIVSVFNKKYLYIMDT